MTDRAEHSVLLTCTSAHKTVSAMAFSFGAKPTASVFSTQAPAQGSLFGNTTQSSTAGAHKLTQMLSTGNAGTLFGSSQQTTSASPFTRPAAAQPTSTAGEKSSAVHISLPRVTGSLFGAPTATSGNSLFASKPLSLATTTTSTTTAPLFGAPAATTTASTGLFGASTATLQQNAMSSVVPPGMPVSSAALYDAVILRVFST